jgi:hypothetical protein
LSFSGSAAEAPVAESGGSLLLSEEFLATCVERFAVVLEGDGGEGARGRPFVAKAMNIQDPLLYYNNLGRSVSKGTHQDRALHVLHRANSRIYFCTKPYFTATETLCDLRLR